MGANNRFRILFNGRPKGSIGIIHMCEATVSAQDLENAHLKLYDTHEHIGQVFRVVIAEPEGEA